MTSEDAFVIRIGLPEFNGTLLRTALTLTNKLLVSAGRFWRQGRMLSPGRAITSDRILSCPAWTGSLNVALDSAGFSAMRHHGGYPWSIRDYVRLAVELEPAWWAQMDYCCEKEIARDLAEVRDRRLRTMETLLEMWHVLDDMRDAAGAELISDPMPVLQGRTPGDYASSAAFALNYLARQQRDIPWLFGVGSVCRRPLRGPEGILPILDTLDRELPAGIRLHWFGAESDAVRELSQHPRAASMDSMAWDSRARNAVRHEGEEGSVQQRAAHMVAWYRQQLAYLRPVQVREQRGLFNV